MKNQIIKISAIVFILFLNACKTENSETKMIESATDENLATHDEWKLIYKNNKDGNIVFGNKEELIAYVRKGNPIRIGWASRRINDTTRTVEHVVDAQFLTIANGNQVFAQIKPFLAQRPDLTSDTLSMTLLPVESNWALGTNGLISSIHIDHSKDTVITSPPKLFGYGLSWFSKVSGSTKKEKPLWD